MTKNDYTEEELLALTDAELIAVAKSWKLRSPRPVLETWYVSNKDGTQIVASGSSSRKAIVSAILKQLPR